MARNLPFDGAAGELPGNHGMGFNRVTLLLQQAFALPGAAETPQHLVV
jgi:hypothetical protein